MYEGKNEGVCTGFCISVSRGPAGGWTAGGWTAGGWTAGRTGGCWTAGWTAGGWTAGRTGGGWTARAWALAASQALIDIPLQFTDGTATYAAEYWDALTGLTDLEKGTCIMFAVALLVVCASARDTGNTVYNIEIATKTKHDFCIYTFILYTVEALIAWAIVCKVLSFRRSQRICA